jgi:hypothetical protein
MTALLACHASVEDDVDATPSAIGERAGADSLSTTEAGIGLLDGYATVFDQRRDPCVSATDGAKPLVGQPQQRTTVQLVQSESELARELGLDTSLSLHTPVGSGEATASVLRSFKGSSQDVNFLLQTVHSYVVTLRGPVSLSDEARQLYETTPDRFLARCGDRFVSSLTFQARLVALITFRTASEDRAASLQSSLAGSIPGGAVTVDGSIKARLSDLAKRRDVQSTIHIVAQGFDADATAGLIGISGNIEEKLAKMDDAATRLAEAVRQDRAKDVEAYATRNDRQVIPGLVAATRYGTTRGAAAGMDTTGPFKASQDGLRKAERFLRKLGEARVRLDHAYRYEVKDFLEAGPEAQANYNVMPPAEPKRYSSELRPIAEAWAARLRSDDAVSSGTDVEVVDEAMAACSNEAKSGVFDACALDAEPTAHPAYRRAAEALGEYARSGRIVKLRQFVIGAGKTSSYRAALDTCADVDGWRDRLPTPDEAARLAPLVAGYGGGDAKTIWTADAPGCAWSASGMPFFRNPLQGQTSSGCDRWSPLNGGARPVICVPQSGPIGKREPLGL